MDKGEENSAHRVHTAGAPVTPLNPGRSDPDSILENGSEPGFREPFPLNIGEIYNSFSMQNVEMWHSIPCRDLLALADAGGEMSMMFGNQVGPFGSSFHRPVPDTRQYGVPNPPMYLYDLNAPPTMVPEPELSIGLSCPFTPVTPAAGRAEHSHVVSNTAVSNEDVGTIREVDKMDTERAAADLHEPPQGAVSTLADSEKGLAVETNLNETPQPPKPPRRRKHRPKVVPEGGRKSAKKPTPAKPEGGSSTGKRKYVRKKGVPTPETGEAGAGAGSGATIEPTTARKTRKPCKRKLDFNEEQNPQTTKQDQVRETHPKVPESQSPSSITPGKTELPHNDPKRPYTKAKCHINFLHETHDKGPDAVPRPNGACLYKEREGSRNNDSMGRARVGESAEAYLSMFTDYNSDAVSGLPLPSIYKKKRTGKEVSFMSPVQETDRGFLAESITGKAPEMSTEKERRFYRRMENFKRQRSKALRLVHDSASFGGMVEGKQRLIPDGASGHQASHQWHAYMEANAADFHVSIATKKRGKKDSTVPSLYQNHQHLTSQIGCDQQLRMKSIYDIDALNNQFKQLNINSRMVQDRHAFTPYMTGYDAKNALVVYQRDRTLVPFEGFFNQVKKRKPRPKVDLDDETSRVWRLLLEDINSQGVNGTDEEKARWWEEERNVFRGRADSFIARMHLVQGDRRFSQWKGSVLDSVIGVFLTQNVSDHLSSSAFMSLAARFPLKPNSSSEPPKEACQVDEAIQVDETIRWHEEKSNQPTNDHGDMMLQDFDSYNEKEAVNSNGFSKINPASVGSKDNSECEVLEISGNNMAMYNDPAIDISAIRISETVTSFMGDQVEADDIVSSQNSTDMSPNSLQFGEELKDGSKATVIGRSTSFVELLHMQGSTMLHGIYSQGEANKSTNKKNELDASESMAYPQEQNNGVSHGHNTTSEEKCASEQSGLSAESASQATVQMVKITSAQEPKSVNTHCEVTTENPKTSTKKCTYNNNFGGQAAIDMANFSAETSEVAESNIVGETSRETVHKVVESNLNDGGNHRMAAAMDEGNSKAKKGKTGKAKAVLVDWDSLRVQAEVKQKRERTDNSMDSLDYDAVRRADVSEVADAIKERGMNNRLAARMKEFLDRLVKDHGSTDLEWLRDVPPDKAKEYLLSFKGLGLKSVECVRLLTLHHLAFPVDTNVGRIAVRLGWVPLQPLPESLQLHLLELYPVLESIQQYLWPRLCKLDQRTLYELHYQMITFGKVFCTKSKPNCNACPMRAECRHFASAFASARLALPAPEDKSMVTTTESKTGQSPTGTINQQHLTLPPPPPDQELQQQFEVQNCDPVIEEPASPEPIVEEPASPEPEPKQTQQMLDIEDFCEDPEDIPMIKLNFEEFTQNLQTYMEKNMELGECDKSRALVALTSEAASIPTPKLKNVSQLRTEHQVYELPDSHPLLEGLDKREPDDPCSYLLAIWTPGETANSIQPPEGQCRSQETGTLCNEETCFFCNSVREANAQTVRGTLLIPCRTAMRGSFPLNGTYFQVNEVFADHDSSLSPIDVPRSWLWNLPRRTVYFGTSIPTIFKGLTTKDIQYCFWRGFVCVRGFDQKTRAPRPLMARLHFPVSKLKRSREKTNEKQKLNQSV